MFYPEVHKFGGSSLSDADCFRRVADIIAQGKQVAVVSAIYGTTNLLQIALDQAEQNLPFELTLQSLLDQQIRVIQALELDKGKRDILFDRLRQDQEVLKGILMAVCLTHSYALPLQELVLGFGEMWSAQILTALLQERGHRALYLNAERIIFISHKLGLVQVDWQKSQRAFDDVLLNADFSHLVITGFIASNEKGKRTTLGRNGSDFSAAIVAKLLSASELIIWTDVDGIYSADPKRVPKAFVLENISYQEILELSYFGAKVLHPGTVAPAIERQIRIKIKNTFNPTAKGTTITQKTVKTGYAVRGISSIDDIALLNIEGSGMVGVSGIAARLFQALSQAMISVILISQASSEHSICLAIRDHEVKHAVEVIESAFALEIRTGVMNRVHVDPDNAILAAVGEGMVGTKGVTARLGQALAQANISIKALAQGSSERNISVVVNRKEINKALRVVHSGFYLSGKTLAIGLIGPGLIGREFLAQVFEAKQTLEENLNVRIYVRGILNSKKMFLSDVDLSLEAWQEHFEKTRLKADIEHFSNALLSGDIPHVAIIDCSASESIARQYLTFLRQGIHIITPNKKANSGDLDYYQQLKAISRSGNVHYLYETTVCAGLPVIKTLQDMIQSGDEIYQLDGIVSGTLAYIFNEYRKTGESFSSILKRAQAAGYTEPDPRDDLTGMDVARKMVVLAREIGLPINLQDVHVHNLVPESLREVSVDVFMASLSDYDGVLAAQLSAITKPGEAVCYVGKIRSGGQIEVTLASYPSDHPFSHLTGTDNILAFHTKRYCHQPLVVQGPGAGASVTAAGIFADVLRLISFLNA